MEIGYDGVLLNTAIAKAVDPVLMAKPLRAGSKRGRAGFEAGLMNQRDMAVPSTPVAGTPFFDSRRRQEPMSTRPSPGSTASTLSFRM